MQMFISACYVPRTMVDACEIMRIKGEAPTPPKIDGLNLVMSILSLECGQ